MLIIFILICSGIKSTNALSASSTFRMFMEMDTLSDQGPPEASVYKVITKSKNIIRCAALCTGQGYCNGIAFNVGLEECRLLTVMPDGTQTSNTSGWTYYVKHVTCDTHAGYILLQGKCYNFHTEELLVDDARDVCRSDGGILARILDSTHQDTLVGHMSSTNWTKTAYVGGTRVDESSPFIWEDGTELVYFNWQIGQPSVSAAGCIRIKPGSGYWFVGGCTISRPFICERL